MNHASTRMEADRDPRARYRANGRGPQDDSSALTALLSHYIDAVRAALRSRAELFSLEAQRAGEAAARLAVLGGVLLIVGGTAWLLLVTTVVLGMAAAGVPLLGALLIVLAAHVVAVFVAVGRIKGITDSFRFSATRRSLRDGLVKLGPREHAPTPHAGVPHMAVPGTPGDVAAGRVGAATGPGSATGASTAGPVLATGASTARPGSPSGAAPAGTGAATGTGTATGATVSGVAASGATASGAAATGAGAGTSTTPAATREGAHVQS